MSKLKSFGVAPTSPTAPGTLQQLQTFFDLYVEEVPADTAESTPQMCFKHKSESAHFEHMRYAPKKRKPRNRVFYK